MSNSQRTFKIDLKNKKNVLVNLPRSGANDKYKSINKG